MNKKPKFKRTPKAIPLLITDPNKRYEVVGRTTSDLAIIELNLKNLKELMKFIYEGELYQDKFVLIEDFDLITEPKRKRRKKKCRK